MIANARMYSVSPETTELWRALLSAIFAKAVLPVTLIDHAYPKPIDELWCRTDKGAVFMCGLPFSRAEPQPVLVAAPVPSPPEFGGEARYWSELVVSKDSSWRSVPDTFGGRLALTAPESQSGCVAALSDFMALDREPPLFGEIIAPTVTPLGALRAVIRGAADIAPIDAYAFRLLERYRPDLTSQVRVVGQTVPAPIPPLVGSQNGLEALTTAFLEAHQDPTTMRLMDRLLLQRFARPDPASYEVLRERFEATKRYWGLHPLAAVTHPAFAL
jgi:ABC-type phosphate/phosphonate transport system substrate-binding protein